MHAWEAIQNTLEFLETHLHEKIDIEELAKVAALSPFYYQRLFSRLVKCPVREYVKHRRLARACEELADKRRRILDIALDVGFLSHETFTRAFKEAFGMTPEQYRVHPVRLNQFDKPDLLLNYTMIDEGVPLISDGLVLEFNRKRQEFSLPFLGFTGLVPMSEQLPPGKATGVDTPGEIWEKFHQEKQSIPRISGGLELGVSSMGDAPEGYFSYFAGAQVEPQADPGRFTRWQLPAGDYVVCGFEAEDFENLVTVALHKAIAYSQLWLEKHHLEMRMFSVEIYGDSSKEASYMELWLPVFYKSELR